jgi:hypothetical protein
MKTPKSTTQLPVELKRLDIRTIELTIEGDSALVVHAWSAKARRQMLDRQMKKASTGRAAKNPVEDFRESLYRHPSGGYGFPVIGIKAAAVDAAAFCDLKKTDMRGSFFVPGELAKIESPAVTKPITACDSEYWKEIAEERKHGASMRSDSVRIAMGTSDIRFRAQFVSWRIKLQVRYNATAIEPAQIVNLINTAGFAIGIGEHRPQRDGQNGMFHVT